MTTLPTISASWPPLPSLEQRVAALERELQARNDQCTRLEIALDEALRQLRALRHEVHTGQTPEQYLAALGAA